MGELTTRFCTPQKAGRTQFLGPIHGKVGWQGDLVSDQQANSMR